MGFVSDARSANSSFVETVWHTHSERAGTFTSAAVSNWEVVITTFDGKTTITARGPETKPSEVDFPADAELFGITFKLGTFMPDLPLKTGWTGCNSSRSAEQFLLAAWLRVGTSDLRKRRRVRRQAYPSGDTRARSGGRGGDTGTHAHMSIRSLQYRFLRATGLTHKTIQQIERARSAVSLLEPGTPVSDTTSELGYFDQAHLTNMLKRFIEKTPAQIAQKSTVE
jgi:AraC-like DNA-binding protein